MIELHRSENILEDQFFNFDYSKQFLTEGEIIALKEIGIMSFYIKGDYSSDEVNFFLKNLLEKLLINHHIYFVLSENYPEKKTRLRSHKKLFYREDRYLGKRNLLETEIDLESSLTVLTSIVKLTPENLKYCIDNLIDSLFQFGYIVQKEKRSFAGNKTKFLTTIIRDKAQIDTRVHLNLLKIAAAFLKGNSFLLRILYDGKDNTSIELLGCKKNLGNLSSKLKDQLKNEFHLRENPTLLARPIP